MRPLVALLALTALVACGADGEPTQPTMNSTITLSSHGIDGQTNVAVRRGSVTFGLGVGL